MIFDSRLHGVVGVEIFGRAASEFAMALQQLQWGAAWIEAFLRRHDYKKDLGDRDHASAVLELIATTLENDKFRAASIAVVTEMAQTFRCDRVSLGLTRRQGVLVHALSHTAGSASE